MLQQGSWTFRYSLEGFLKRVLHSAQFPLSESDLVEAVLTDWAGPEEQSRESIVSRVRASLLSASGPFASVEDERYILRTDRGDDFQNRAYRFLQDQGGPQKHGEILRHLQKETGRGRGDLMSRVDLDGDPRFARLDSGEWLLTEWELANDAIARLMQERNVRRAELDELLAWAAEADGRGKSCIFHPEFDPRFAILGNHVECLLVEQEAAAALETILPETEELMMTTTIETQETQTQDTAFDLSLVPTRELVDVVLNQLLNLSGELQKRNQEMPNEVLTLFNSEDLQGIEALMLQRKRVGTLAEELLSFAAKWSDELDAK